MRRKFTFPENCAIMAVNGGLYMTSVSVYYDGSTYVVTEESVKGKCVSGLWRSLLRED